MDNGFSAGDGDRRVSDIGNFAHSGHYSNFIPCPEELLTFPGGFDRGGVNFADLNQPRDVYDPLMPPVNPEDYDANPLGFFLTYVSQFLGGGSLEGEYCQNAGLTSLGEFLIEEMMKRGMVIEVDHFSRQSYKRAYEILGENDYPAVGTHGMPIAAVLLALAGIIQVGASICLLLNKQVVVCALGLAIMVLLINVSLHDFWNVYEDVNAERETQNFFKNLGIFAGLLLLAGTGMPQQGRNKITNV